MYTELPMKENVNRLKTYVKEKEFTRTQLTEVSSVLTGMIAKKMIEWGVIFEFE
jgi:hypothetical protein